MSTRTLTLDDEDISSIRRALNLGLDSFGEIERLANQQGVSELLGNAIPPELQVMHTDGSGEAICTFAAALRLLECAA